MIPVPSLAGLVGETLIYENIRALAERGVSDAFVVATEAPLRISGNGTDGSTITQSVGASAVLRGGKLTVGLLIPLPTKYGGTGTSTTFTPGSVVFAGASGNYAEDNAHLFWDDTNNRLGVGTPSPTKGSLEVGGASGLVFAAIHGGSTIGLPYGSALRIVNSGIDIGFVGNQSACIGGAYADKFTIAAYGSTNQLLLNPSGGNVGIGTTGPQRLLDVSNTGYARAKVQDYGGQVFNVMAYGAVGDGTTDDTAAISAAFTAANATTPGGTVFFPSGFSFKTQGGHTISANGVRVSGYGATIKLEHATNDLFTISTGANRDDITFEGFVVDSTTVRSSGWVIKWAPAYNSGQVLRRCRIRDVTMLHQFHGIWQATYEYNWLDRVLYDYPSSTGSTGALAFKIGQTATTDVVQGSEIYLTNCQANNRSATANALSTGFWFEDCDAVYLKGCGSIASVFNFVVTNTAHGCCNFFWNQVVSDGTAAAGGHSTLIQGAVANQRFTITNSWFGSAGRGTPGGGASGLQINAGMAVNWTITNCEFYNNSAYGMYCKDFIGIVSGCTFNANTTKALYVDATNAGTLAGQFNSNYFIGGGGAGDGWQTAATAARCGFNGNFYTFAPVYGVAPAQNVNNVTY